MQSLQAPAQYPQPANGWSQPIIAMPPAQQPVATQVPQPASEDHTGLRLFQAFKIGVSSILSSFIMSGITHNLYRRVFLMQLFSNTLEAMAVTTLYSGKIPFINQQITKIQTLLHPNQPPKCFEELSIQEKERILPYMSAFITGTSTLIQMCINIKQGKMRDKSTKPMNTKTLMNHLRLSFNTIRQKPSDSLKHIGGFAKTAGRFWNGLAPLRFLNKNPVLALILPVISASTFGFIEGRAATALANKTRE